MGEDRDSTGADTAEVVERLDYAEVGELRKDANGFYTGTVNHARSGIQTYRDPRTGKLIKELRRPETVARADQLAMYAMKPIIAGHTSGGPVTPETIRSYQIGFTGETHRAVKLDDGETAAQGTICVTHADGIEDARQKLRQALSWQYLCKSVRRPGVYKGQRYDCENVGMELVNALATCRKARSGSADLTFRVDSQADLGVQVTEETTEGRDDGHGQEDRPVGDQNTQGATVAVKINDVTFRLDGQAAEALSAERQDQATTLAEAQATIKTKDGELVTANTKIAELEAEKTRLDGELEAEKAAHQKTVANQAELTSPERLDGLVAEREELKGFARQYKDLAARLDGSEGKAPERLTNAELKREIIRQELGDVEGLRLDSEDANEAAAHLAGAWASVRRVLGRANQETKTTPAPKGKSGTGRQDGTTKTVQEVKREKSASFYDAPNPAA